MKTVFYSMSISIIVFFGAISNANSQVTIGSLLDPDATLDVRSSTTAVADGVLVPRLTGDELVNSTKTYSAAQEGALIYIKSAATTPGSGKFKNVKASGFFYYDSVNDVWVPLSSSQPSQPKDPVWFYMPPVPINVETGNNKSIDLFEKFVASITEDDSFTPTGWIGSASAPNFSNVLDVNTLSATDFYYYVVGYDKSIFNNIIIAADGKMTYDIVDDATDESYINIVLVKSN